MPDQPPPQPFGMDSPDSAERPDPAKSSRAYYPPARQSRDTNTARTLIGAMVLLALLSACVVLIYANMTRGR